MIRAMTRDRYLSDAELARLFAAVRTRRHKNRPRDHALLALLANTGIRPAEARGLRRSDLHLRERPAWIRLPRVKRPHTSEPISHLFVHRRVADVVMFYAAGLAEDALLFGFSKRQLSRLFAYYLKRAGIETRFKPFALRHSYGMRLWRASGDARLIQAMMGHAHLKAAFNYDHLTAERLRQIRETLGTIR